MKILMPGFCRVCASLVSACLLVTSSPSFALPDDHLTNLTSRNLHEPAAMQPLLTAPAPLEPKSNQVSTKRRPKAGRVTKTNAKSPVPHGSRQLTFIENKGQFDEQVKFQATNAGRMLWLTQSGIVFDFQQCAPSGIAPSWSTPISPGPAQIAKLGKKKTADCVMERHVINQGFLGSSEQAKIETREVQPGVRNYLTGSDPAKWQTQVRGFSEVVYHDLWPSIDLRLYGKGPDLEQEFIVNPGADAGQVQLAYKGIDNLKVGNDGSLLVHAAAGMMRETRPRIYQEIRGRRVPVKGRFKLLSSTSYTFEIAAYDKQKPLVIDPTLLYSTFLGGSSGTNATGIHETASGVAVDQSGNAYVTGFTQSPDFPTTPGAFQTGFGGGQQTFVTKLNPAGNGLIYSTYLNASFPNAIAVDTSGNAYVAGSNTHAGFATTANAYSQFCDAPGGVPFLTVLNPSGSGLLYSTCFAGALSITSMAIDEKGHAFVAGVANNTLPATLNAYQLTYPGSLSSAFVTEFDTTQPGTASLVYSTYLGIPGSPDGAHTGTQASAVAVDSFGKIYLTGFAADGFPVTPGAFQTIHAPCIPNGIACPPSVNAFIAKLDPSVSGQQSLIYGTYFGGMGFTSVNTIAVDASGNAYIAGTAQNTLPTTPGAFQSSPPFGTPLAGAGGGVGFITKLNTAGSQLVYSTYLANACIPGVACFGQTGTITSIALDELSSAYVTGFAGVNGVPVTPDAFQSTVAKASGDFSVAFVTRLNPTGTSLVYSSLLGGEGNDTATAIAVDPSGDAYVVGQTTSGSFPTTLGTFQAGLDGTGDAFVTKFPLGASQTLSLSSISPATGGNIGTVTGRILGAGFHAGASVMLTGATTITGATSIGSEGRTIDVTFDLTGAPAGIYDLAVANPDGTSTILPGAFTVQNGGAPQLGVTVLLPPHLAVDHGPTTLTVQVQNTGNVDAYGVIVTLYGIPNDATLKPLFTIASPSDALGGQTIDFSSAPFAPVVGQEQIPSLLLSKVPAGDATALSFSLALSTVPSSPPLMPAPPITIAPPLSNLRITAIAVQLSDLCHNKELGCIQGIIGTTLAVTQPELGLTLARISCFESRLCAELDLALKHISPGQGKSVYNFYQLSLKLLLDCTGAVVPEGSISDLIAGIAGAFTSILDCVDLIVDEVEGFIDAVGGVARDPNDKEGPTGITASHWIQSQPLVYGVYFSNEPAATAAAVKVLVTDTIDPFIDLSTLKLTGITVAGNSIAVPPGFAPELGHNAAITTIDFRPVQNLLTNVDIVLDPASRMFTVQFSSIDPSTGLPPSNPALGVLAPGAEGSVTYSARPIQTVSTGAQISNQATIIFDTNTPMTTPVWVNTIDNTPPVSQVVALPVREPASGFTLAWSGTDVGSGVQDFTIFVSDNGGPFTPFQTNTAATSATFTGEIGHTYGFYSVARDLVGNIEASKTAAEASTQVVLISDSTPPTTSVLSAPTPNAAGWNNSNVTITLNAADDPGGTGVKQISYSATGAQSIASTTVPAATTSFQVSTEGLTTIAFFGTDNAGNMETPKTLTVEIDKTPPIITCSVSPNVLWPPNDKLMPVNANVTVADSLSGSVSFNLVSVTSSEPDSGLRDIQGFVAGTSSVSGQLRAQRLGSGKGRVYTLTYSGLDRAGNPAACTTTVVVPHDQGH